ncbi:peptidyl-prolyl cis-trans isomerase [Campylobacter hominis]|uniref:Putative periplasmic protein n=1 Tax=Campylobacter hominis (strain ATCC BAA-381 / DSM 21671 / CCUG 45161 / LMG 19568 / NCTC 13146 / CH001A) TaxID=360107 RepID=A7HZN2_CAMHC|nr:peptidyl-prolyl cis-trans isomerase [Campylobacter hominis]ABS52322.1 putative periplasmic protein [Campylobacter hominis ATCC BAA-381]UAK85418.1 peptidyl-prolyl cis-trans isomerase [Campylobacter hominis]SUW84272.1 putative periplasmic protein [Campylobacter hominis]
MKKKFVFLSLIFGFCLANADVINGVVAVVENEPITHYELNKMIKTRGLNPNDALEVLIKNKLQVAEIKRLGIITSDYETNERIKAIAAQNKISVDTMQASIKKQGGTWSEFKENVRNSLQEEKLYAAIFKEVAKSVTPENVEKFYNENPSLFTTYDSVNLIRYISKNANALSAIKAGKNADGVQKISGVLKNSQMNESLRYVVSNVGPDGFSPIIPTKLGYEMFKVNSKNGVNKISFEEAQQKAIEAYTISERKKAIENFNQKLRSNAIIKIIKH